MNIYTVYYPTTVTVKKQLSGACASSTRYKALPPNAVRITLLYTSKFKQQNSRARDISRTHTEVLFSPSAPSGSLNSYSIESPLP